MRLSANTAIFVSLVSLFMGACFMTEDAFEGSSEYKEFLENTQIKVVTTEPFSLDASDGIVRDQRLGAVDGTPRNAYMLNRDDIQTTVWMRFWMGDSIISKSVEIDSTDNDQIDSSTTEVISNYLLNVELDDLKPRLILHLDQDYYDLYENGKVALGDQVNLRLKYFVDQYDFNAEDYKESVEENYINALGNDSVFSEMVSSTSFPNRSQVDSLDVSGEFLIESDTLWAVDSETQDSTISSISQQPKLRIYLSNLPVWDSWGSYNLLRSQDTARHQFLSLGISMLDDVEVTPITSALEDNLSLAPKLAMDWKTDETIIYSDSNASNSKEIEINKSVTEYVERYTRLLQFEVNNGEPDREGRLKLYSDIGDTLKLTMAWDQILEAIEVNDLDEDIRDDKAIVWAKLKIPLAPNAFESTRDEGAVYKVITNLYEIDNTPDFLNNFEHQFQDSSFSPESILWETNQADTLSLYITRLASRVVNRNLSGDSVKVALSYSYGYSDSTSNYIEDQEFASIYRTFDVLDLGKKEDLQVQVELGFVDLEGGDDE